MKSDTDVRLLTEKFGTPLYVYDANAIRGCYSNLREAFSELSPHIQYSVKANSNLAVLRMLHELGASFDIVSGGELARLQAAGIPTHDVSFAGVGKTHSEIEAALHAEIAFFNIESAAELDRIAKISAELKIPTRALLRLNPDVDVKTHKYITTEKAANKFGLDFVTGAEISDKFRDNPWVKVVGYHMHIGSQIQEVTPYLKAAKKIVDFISDRRAAGQFVQWLSLGGGFGVSYDGTEELSLNELARQLKPVLRGQDLQLVLEPGRSMMASSGMLLMTVQYIKQAGEKVFIIVDAGMHSMIRPALYSSWHKVWPVDQPEDAKDLIKCDVVGPICESSDFFAKDRLMPRVKSGDVLALHHAGAYGMVMASNYNSHPRPAEVLVDGKEFRLIRRRETYADLTALDILEPEQTGTF